MRASLRLILRRGLFLAASVVMATTPLLAGAQDDQAARLASWLFDNYVDQQLEAAATRAVARDPAVAAAIVKSRGAIILSLSRHRGPFEAQIKPAIEANIKAGDLAGLDKALREISAGREAGLSDAQRRGLTALDQEFRHNGQAVIRAVAIDLEALVAEARKQATSH